MTDNSATAVETTQGPGRPPREIRTSITGHILRVFLIGLTVLFPVLFIMVARSERVKYQRLYAEGKQVAATVVGKSSRKSTHTLRYQYTLDGRTYKGSAKVDSGQYNATPVNSTVAITYLPGDPNTSVCGVVQAGAAASKEQTNLLIGLLCTAGALVGTIAIERSIRRDRRLCEYGIAVEGAVTEQVGGKNAKTRYVFTPEDGQPCHGAAQASFATRRMAVGEALTVLYDPENPSHNKPHKGIGLAKVVNQGRA